MSEQELIQMEKDHLEDLEKSKKCKHEMITATYSNGEKEGMLVYCCSKCVFFLEVLH